MKNRRGLIIGMWCVLITCFSATTAKADDVPAPGNVKLKIEAKRITQAEAEQYVKSGEKVTIGVYLVLDQGWKNLLNSNKVGSASNQISFAFFEDETYATADFLQNPTDYIAICAQKRTATPPSWACDNITTSNPLEWYTAMDWYNPVEYGWPTYAYGGLFRAAGTIFPGMNYIKEIDGNFEIKVFDIQFILKKSDRNLPIGILDDGVKTDGALGATEVSVINDANDAYRPSGILAADWTELPAPYFEFIPGGLFIETAPEWEKFERSFVA